MLIRKVTVFPALPLVCFLISCGYHCVSGQNLFWLVLPYGSRSPRGQSEIGYPFQYSSYGVNSVYDNLFTHNNEVLDQRYTSPFHQRSFNQALPFSPQVQHLIVEEEGSASDILWSKHESKRIKSKVKDEEEPEMWSVTQPNKNEVGFYGNSGIVRRNGDENGDIGSNNLSNESGSSEISLMPLPSPLYGDDVDVPFVLQSLTTASNVNNGNVKCKNSEIEGNQAYDQETGRCFTVGTRGPCGKMMIFTAVPGDSLNGFCDCDHDSYDRPLVLLGGQCYFLYTQALCYPGYWLTSITPESEPVCEMNPCHGLSLAQSHSSRLSEPTIFFKGECISLNTPSRFCKREGEVVLFPKGSVKPTCGFHPKSKKRIYRRQISSIRSFSCRPGETRHIRTKKCVRLWRMIREYPSSSQRRG